MAEVKLFGRSRSTYVRTARLALAEKGVAYDLDEMSAGDNTKEPYLSERHPFGRIPAFQHGDFKLYETQAIIRYVDSVFPGPQLQPQGLQELALMNQAIGIVDAYMWVSAAAAIIRNQLMAPKFNLAVDQSAVDAAIPKATTSISEISRMLGKKEFIVGTSISLADLMVAPIMSYLKHTSFGEDALKAHPNMIDWIGGIEKRPSAAAVLLPV